jgi:hypothetical protein
MGKHKKAMKVYVTIGKDDPENPSVQRNIVEFVQMQNNIGQQYGEQDNVDMAQVSAALPPCLGLFVFWQA